MSEDGRNMLDTQIRNLYKIIEVPSIGAAPSAVSCDTLRLANPTITVEEAREMVEACDERGDGKLSVSQFSTLLRNGLRKMDPYHAAIMLGELVSKMRLAFRRKLLTYDSPPNVLPKFLMENSAVVSSFRRLFDKLSNNNEYITRQIFNEFVDGIFIQYSYDTTGSVSQTIQSLANNIIKAAADTEDRQGFIGFNEFVMVINVATNHIPLGEIIQRGSEYNRIGPDLTNSRILSVRSNADTAMGSPKLITTTYDPSEKNDGSRTLRTGATFQGVSQDLYMKAENLRPLGSTVGGSERVLELKEQIAKFDIEREELKSEIARWKQKASGATDQNRNRDILGNDLPQQDDEIDVKKRISILEDELRLCKSQLGLSKEASELIYLLKQSYTTDEALRCHFLDEAPLLAKHRFLRDKANIIDVNSPQGIILSQYELLVCGYQALLRKETEMKPSASRRTSPNVRVTSPSRSMSGVSQSCKSVSTNRCIRVRGSPFKWSEVDRPISHDAWRSGTIADPILTAEERRSLRNKLATQMRCAARATSPHLKAKERNYLPRQSEESEPVTPGLTSHEAMMRLQNISSKVVNNWRVKK